MIRAKLLGSCWLTYLLPNMLTNPTNPTTLPFLPILPTLPSLLNHRGLVLANSVETLPLLSRIQFHFRKNLLGRLREGMLENTITVTL
jgi:hypothetical protein